MEGGVTAESTDMEDETVTPVNPGRAPEQVSELGGIIISDPIAGPAVLHTVSDVVHIFYYYRGCIHIKLRNMINFINKNVSDREKR